MNIFGKFYIPCSYFKFLELARNNLVPKEKKEEMNESEEDEDMADVKDEENYV
jgi:hypothetical protein